MRKLTVFGILILCIQSGYCWAATHYKVDSVPATRVFEKIIYLSSGSHTFETDNLVGIPGWGTPDTVLYVWDEYSGHEVGHNDDITAGVRRSKLVIYIPPGSERHYKIVVHAHQYHNHGTANLVHNGQVVDTGFYFGGARIVVNAQGSQPGQTWDIHAVLTPGGSTDTKLYGLECGTEYLVAIDDDNGVGYGSKITGREICWVIVGAYDANSEGNTRIIVNDAWNDHDGDSLGSGLEAALGTCDSVLTVSYCQSVVNFKDSDHDGLFDQDEVLGKDTWPPLYLPKWGASPIRKDLFIELDYTFSSPSDHPFGDDSTKIRETAQTIQAYFSVGSSSDLNNPDGSNGISLHMDIGRDPTPTDLASYPELITLYGNWGGETNLPTPTGGSIQYNLTYKSEYNKFYSPVSEQGYGFFSAERIGFFRYVIAARNCTPGVGSNLECRSFATPVSDRVYWLYNQKLGKFSDYTLVHELGHVVGLQHWGKSEWGKINCKPNYRSIMNYTASSPIGFSNISESGVQSINPKFAVDTDGLNIPGFSPSFLGLEPFHFLLGTALPWLNEPVDWNRDGLFQGVQLRASLTWNNCSYSSQGEPVNHKYHRQYPHESQRRTKRKEGEYTLGLFFGLQQDERVLQLAF